MTAPAYALPLDAEGRRSTGWWGLVMLLVTEAALFLFLLFSYFYLGSMTPAGYPAGGDMPSLRLALPNTVLLLLSSGAFWWAERGIRAGQGDRLRLGLLATLLLGAVFLTIQVREWASLPFSPRTDAYGSLWFTIAGFHAAHVAVGLVMLAVVLLRALRGHFTARRHLAVTNTGWYWHFVDVVWLFVFTSLYLSPRLR